MWTRACCSPPLACFSKTPGLRNAVASQYHTAQVPNPTLPNSRQQRHTCTPAGCSLAHLPQQQLCRSQAGRRARTAPLLLACLPASGPANACMQLCKLSFTQHMHAAPTHNTAAAAAARFPSSTHAGTAQERLQHVPVCMQAPQSCRHAVALHPAAQHTPASSCCCCCTLRQLFSPAHAAATQYAVSSLPCRIPPHPTTTNKHTQR
jgi:hypothetical protein